MGVALLTWAFYYRIICSAEVPVSVARSPSARGAKFFKFWSLFGAKSLPVLFFLGGGGGIFSFLFIFYRAWDILSFILFFFFFLCFVLNLN